jgi:carbon monoxide dehydrogenase subunit G
VKIRLSSHLPVTPGRAFSALVDPEVLRRCIPGCEELSPAPESTGSGASYVVRLKVGVAGLKGSYAGRVTIRDQRPPEALTLGFEGQGGPGFVRGEAAITLREPGAIAVDNYAEGRPPGSPAARTGTEIACEADVQVGGLIAAVGSRLVEATAKKLSDDFFRQVSVELSR